MYCLSANSISLFTERPFSLANCFILAITFSSTLKGYGFACAIIPHSFLISKLYHHVA
nr:MAG TPA: hypothetical protein [Caudoviricetes sp.]